ncbi:hypothetical protein [Nocardia brasiliensis]|uniref:hypothetical protein n=1 Tax=Nocardia brasiliensis TaxID=37326 RepID=UPI0024575F7A|nr:hypothetical protein [Nocardia brasiliensis]
MVEVVVTQAGDVLGRIVFEIVVDRAARAEVMLLPASDLWEPLTCDGRDRLRQLVSAFGIRW